MNIIDGLDGVDLGLSEVTTSDGSSTWDESDPINLNRGAYENYLHAGRTVHQMQHERPAASAQTTTARKLRPIVPGEL